MSPGILSLSLEVLFFTWVVAGSDEVQWDGEVVRFCQFGCHVSRLTRVEEAFRCKAVELTHTPGISIPWGVALLRDQARRKFPSREQRRYLLEHSLPSSVRATGLPKGKGKTGRKKGGGLQVKVEETLPPPLRHRVLAGQVSNHQEPATCKTWVVQTVQCWDGVAKVGKVAEWHTVAMFDWRAPVMHVERGTTPGFLTTLRQHGAVVPRWTGQPSC